MSALLLTPERCGTGWSGECVVVVGGVVVRCRIRSLVGEVGGVVRVGGQNKDVGAPCQ